MANILDLNDRKKCEEFKIAFNKGSIFAYPTEAVFGLGCDISNISAIKRILDIKKRNESKGLIVISDNFEKIRDLIDARYHDLFLQNCKDATRTTWLWPASNKTLGEVTGGGNKIAIRITKHPVCISICKLLQQPIISTSANISGENPTTTFDETLKIFNESVDFIINDSVGINKKPSRILDLLTKKILRAGG